MRLIPASGRSRDFIQNANGSKPSSDCTNLLWFGKKESCEHAISMRRCPMPAPSAWIGARSIIWIPCETRSCAWSASMGRAGSLMVNGSFCSRRSVAQHQSAFGCRRCNHQEWISSARPCPGVMIESAESPDGGQSFRSDCRLYEVESKAQRLGRYQNRLAQWFALLEHPHPMRLAGLEVQLNGLSA